ncbi:MAG: hypothetical protein JNL98_04340 [Bryobacterales bacterium]|nr:hypothetical protein [Bryobacterales bacterium]
MLRLDGGTKRFRLGLNVSRLSGLQVQPSIHGKIRTSGDRRGSLWVRLTALLNQHDTEEVAVGADGSFAFEALPPGEYAVLVIENDRLLVSRQVSCFGAVRLEIPVGNR